MNTITLDYHEKDHLRYCLNSRQGFKEIEQEALEQDWILVREQTQSKIASYGTWQLRINNKVRAYIDDIKLKRVLGYELDEIIVKDANCNKRVVKQYAIYPWDEEHKRYVEWGDPTCETQEECIQAFQNYLNKCKDLIERYKGTEGELYAAHWYHQYLSYISRPVMIKEKTFTIYTEEKENYITLEV